MVYTVVKIDFICNRNGIKSYAITVFLYLITFIITLILRFSVLDFAKVNLIILGVQSFADCAGTEIQ